MAKVETGKEDIEESNLETKEKKKRLLRLEKETKGVFCTVTECTEKYGFQFQKEWSSKHRKAHWHSEQAIKHVGLAIWL